ncbi:MAG: M20 family metallo-hydrolase [Elusimicrobia bacterium]|nr:M20 family metallo-hydrolase [Elusimicrobiota bacterium]
MKDIISRKIDSYLEYAVELQTGLTARPAIAPCSGGEGEYEKAVWLEKELKKLNFDEVFRIDAPQKEAKKGIRPNIVARYKGSKRGKTLWIMSHLDVVPPGEASLWKTDPYKLVREGKKIYGRGVEDNQQGVVSSILCARVLMDLGLRPEADLGLLFNADEETASEYGADYVLEKRRDIFGKKDMFIIPDFGNSDGSLVEVAEKSLLWLKVRTEGRQCHASNPDAGANSFRAASDLVVRLASLYKKFSKRDRQFMPPVSTFEPTKKDPNVPNINTIPGEDVFYLDCRVLPCYKIADVIAEIKRQAAPVEKKYGVSVSLEPVQQVQAAPPTSPDAEVVRLIISGVKQVYGHKAKPCGIGGGTVAASFRKAGFDAAVFSRLDEVAHQPNEYCILDNLLGDAKVFALAALNLKA